VATLDLRDCVMAGRWNGRGTLGALGRIAETYGVSLKWAKKLFFNDGHVAMSAERRRLLALRAADFLERVADDLDRKAALLRALAAEKRDREEQLRLPLAVRRCGEKGSHRCAA
jgi:hypothetical protein